MTGGNFSNTTFLPSDFVINYGGSGAMTVTGGTNAFAVINAPNSAITRNFRSGNDRRGAAGGNPGITGNAPVYTAPVPPPPNPLPPQTMKGGSNFYGQIVGKTIDDQGGTNFYWDKSLVSPPPNTNPLYERLVPHAA